MAQVISSLILIMVTFVSDENIGVSVYDKFLNGNKGGGGGGAHGIV